MRKTICLLFLIGYGAFGQSPSVSAVVNAATYLNGPAAAGSLISIFGSNFGTGTAASAAPLPTTVTGVSVKIGSSAAPIQYVSPGQINVQVPWDVPAGKAAVVVTANGAASAPVDLTVGAVSPGVFGALPAATRIYGAVRQGEYLAIYGTGFGDVAKNPVAGAAATGDAVAVKGAVSATIGGMAATVGFAGLAPSELFGYDSVGLYEVDVLVPANAPTGASIPVAVSVNGTAANAINIAVAPSGPAQTIAQWTQMGPNGAIARAITSMTSCPAVKLNGTDTAMQVRAAASLPFYPVTSCELALPGGASSASINGSAFPLPTANVKRITVVGDTGCRMDASNLQACSDPIKWPAGIVAASAAATKPDVLIHMGDLHYREVPCAAGNAGCAGSPWGYNWAVWNADYFTAMNAWLAAAPIVNIRGNHESCARAGEGWFRFLDPRPYGACNQYTDPYTVQAGPVQFFVMDSSEATDTAATAAVVDKFRPQFDMLKQVAGSNTWVMMHHPIWAFDGGANRNLSLQTASGNFLGDGVQMALAGHLHTFQTLTFSPTRTPQMVSGNGGDNLQVYPATTTNFDGQSIGNAMVTDSALFTGFGFATLDWNGTGWDAQARDIYGAPVLKCTVGGYAIKCAGTN